MHRRRRPGRMGQRVIRHRLTGRVDRNMDASDLGMLTYLLESGSDRIETGQSLSPEMDIALMHGTSIGGARPKVLLSDGGRQLIAKLSSRTDPYPVVKAEAAAMALAARVGLDVAKTQVTRALGHDVLLVERCDRTGVIGQRRMMVSALTMLGLDSMQFRYAAYHDLADVIRARFTDPDATLRELFARIVCNICVRNTDHHARNHAAFWNGEHLSLTPAYDLCPQVRSGGTANQGMAISPDGFRRSQLAGTVRA
ncbi:MAG: hypothetical protein F2840_14010 [Actinobacteria bacterium]|nr:hypothetical protein [Actinomycetota bacterium]